MRVWSALMAGLVGCAPFAPAESPDYRADTFTGERDVDVVRVMTWNIETVGEPGTAEYDAALAMIDRLRPDVLALNEVAGAWDADNAEWLAVDAGFPHYVVGGSGYGDDRNAILSMFPLEAAGGLTAAELSGDPRANDITREFVAATVQTPRGDLDVVSMHWKSGWDDDDEFRRVLESHRSVQALDPNRPAVLTGDWNEDIRDGSDWPQVWHSIPYGMPNSFWLGGDLWSALNDEGLPNDPFAPLLAADLEVHEIRQRSGTDATRPVSGRRLDYIATSHGLETRGVEVFDCKDQHRAGGVEHYGSPVANDLCPTASDHLPVIADIVLGETRPVDPTGVDALVAGDLVVTELLANPDACPDSTGEWIEVENTTDAPVDLAGLEIVDASGNRSVVDSGAIEPGGLAVLVRGTSPCGPVHAGTYSSPVSLNNGGDTVALIAAGRELDVVSYPRNGGQAGSSWLVGLACAGVPTPGSSGGTCD